MRDITADLPIFISFVIHAAFWRAHPPTAPSETHPAEVKSLAQSVRQVLTQLRTADRSERPMGGDQALAVFERYRLPISAVFSAHAGLLEGAEEALCRGMGSRPSLSTISATPRAPPSDPLLSAHELALMLRRAGMLHEHASDSASLEADSVSFVSVKSVFRLLLEAMQEPLTEEELDVQVEELATVFVPYGSSAPLPLPPPPPNALLRPDEAHVGAENAESVIEAGDARPGDQVATVVDLRAESSGHRAFGFGISRRWRATFEEFTELCLRVANQTTHADFSSFCTALSETAEAYANVRE